MSEATSTTIRISPLGRVFLDALVQAHAAIREEHQRQAEAEKQARIRAIAEGQPDPHRMHGHCLPPERTRDDLAAEALGAGARAIVQGLASHDHARFHASQIPEGQAGEEVVVPLSPEVGILLDMAASLVVARHQADTKRHGEMIEHSIAGDPGCWNVVSPLRSHVEVRDFAFALGTKILLRRLTTDRQEPSQVLYAAAEP
jgi:hypothetical protein